MIRIEKFRPQRFDEIIGNEKTISRLSVFTTNGNAPNIIISVKNFIFLSIEFKCVNFIILNMLNI